MKVVYSAMFIIVGALLGYISWTSFGVFGTMRSLICFLISVGTLSYLHAIPITKQEEDNSIIFNPSESPKYLGITIILAMSAYLLWFAYHRNLSETKLLFAYIEVTLLGVLPSLWIIICLIRDRNDFISINNEKLIISNAHFFSKKYTEIDIEQIQTIKREHTNIYIHQKNNETFVIKGNEMNLFENEIVEVEIFIKMFLKDRIAQK